MTQSPRQKAKSSPVMKIDRYMTGIDVRKLVQVRNFGRVHYRLGSVLGKGGFAKVYQAEQSYQGKNGIHINRQCAVKIVPKARVTRPDQIKRVKCEIAIQSKISHPNILRMLTSWEDNEKYCMALEFCEQKTLLSYVRTFPSKMVPEKETINVMRQLLSAVEYLHDNDIIHRDIKLGNVLRQQGVIKLGDFGLAVNYKTDETRALCGTPNFLSPEVFRHKMHSTASDIWAVGCVLYTLLAGENPFKYVDMQTTQRVICAMEYTIPAYISSEAVQAIKLLLDEDYKARPSASDIPQLELFVKYDEKRTLFRTKSNPDQVRRSLYFENRSPSSTGLSRHPLQDFNQNVPDRSKSSSTGPFQNHPPPMKRITSRRRLVDEMDMPTTSSRKRPAESDAETSQVKQIKSQNSVYVTKWLDYFNRIGFGYTLSDGSTAVMMQNGCTIRGTNNNDVEMIRNSERRVISNSSAGDDVKALKRWKQFHDYMETHLLSGVEKSNDEHSDKLVVVTNFIRNERAVCFILSNGIRQINFMDGNREKYIIKRDGIIKVEARKQKPLTWLELGDVLDERTLEQLTYAKGKFDWINTKDGIFNNNDHDDTLATFIAKFH